MESLSFIVIMTVGIALYFLYQFIMMIEDHQFLLMILYLLLFAATLFGSGYFVIHYVFTV